jgi:hypothetical protein
MASRKASGNGKAIVDEPRVFKTIEYGPSFEATYRALDFPEKRRMLHLMIDEVCSWPDKEARDLWLAVLGDGLATIHDKESGQGEVSQPPDCRAAVIDQLLLAIRALITDNRIETKIQKILIADLDRRHRPPMNKGRDAEIIRLYHVGQSIDGVALELNLGPNIPRGVIRRHKAKMPACQDCAGRKSAR